MGQGCFGSLDLCLRGDGGTCVCLKGDRFDFPPEASVDVPGDEPDASDTSSPDASLDASAGP